MFSQLSYSSSRSLCPGEGNSLYRDTVLCLLNEIQKQASKYSIVSMILSLIFFMQQLMCLMTGGSDISLCACHVRSSFIAFSLSLQGNFGPSDFMMRDTLAGGAQGCCRTTTFVFSC